MVTLTPGRNKMKYHVSINANNQFASDLYAQCTKQRTLQWIEIQ
jgi:hypothetical protein